MATMSRSTLERAIILINACRESSTNEQISAHLDAPVTAKALRRACMTRRGLQALARDHGLSPRLMCRLSGLRRLEVRLALRTTVELVCASGFPPPLRRQAARTLALFLSSQWQSVALDVTRPMQTIVEPQRNLHARVIAKSSKVCVALLAIVADPMATDVDRAWALRQIESTAKPAVQAITVFRNIPATVLRGSVPTKMDGKSLSMIQQSAVLADPHWVAALVPFCSVYCLFEIPARVLRQLPAPESVRLATLYMQAYLLSEQAVATQWVNAYCFAHAMPPVLRTPDVLLRLIALEGLRPERRSMLLEWLTSAYEHEQRAGGLPSKCSAHALRTH